MLNKKGNVFVEAAIVLPLIILIIVSLLGLLVFFYTGLKAQCDVHSRLTVISRDDDSLFLRVNENVLSSVRVKGFVKKDMKSVSRETVHVINEADIVRMGEIGDDLQTGSEIE